MLGFDQILRILDGGGTLALAVIVYLQLARIDRRLDAMHGQVVDLLSDALGVPRPTRPGGRPPSTPAPVSGTETREAAGPSTSPRRSIFHRAAPGQG